MKPTRHTPRNHSNPPYPKDTKEQPQLASAVTFMSNVIAGDASTRTYNISNTMLSCPSVPYLPRMSLASVLKMFAFEGTSGAMKFETPATLIMFYKIGDNLSADYLDKTTNLRICIVGLKVDIQHSAPNCYIMSNANAVGGRLVYDKLVLNANNTRQYSTVDVYSDAVISMDSRMVQTADLRFELDLCAIYNTTEKLRLSTYGPSFLLEYREVNVVIGGSPITVTKLARNISF